MQKRKTTPRVGAGWLTPVSTTAPTSAIAAAAAPLPNGAPPPPAPMQQPAMNIPYPGEGGSLDPLSMTIMWLNTNPYLIGILMLLLNLGGRFLSLELTKKQEAFLQAPWIRPMILFTVIFVATRNLVASFWVTLLFFFVIWVAANENSPFCMIPNWCGHDTKTPAELYEANIAALKSYWS
jgi:hypothetical protein